MKYEVTGTHKVAGVEPGGTVELDSDRINVEALQAAGQVRAKSGKAGKRKHTVELRETAPVDGWRTFEPADEPGDDR